MDNNQTPAPAAPSNVTPPAPAAPVQQPTDVQPQVAVTNSSGDSKKIIMWLVIGIVIIAALVGGIYFFLSRQPAVDTTQAPAEKSQTLPEPPETVDALERDLNALTLEDSETDFVSVDQDLQEL